MRQAPCTCEILIILDFWPAMTEWLHTDVAMTWGWKRDGGWVLWHLILPNHINQNVSNGVCFYTFSSVTIYESFSNIYVFLTKNPPSSSPIASQDVWQVSAGQCQERESQGQFPGHQLADSVGPLRSLLSPLIKLVEYALYVLMFCTPAGSASYS